MNARRQQVLGTGVVFHTDGTKTVYENTDSGSMNLFGANAKCWQWFPEGMDPEDPYPAPPPKAKLSLLRPVTDDNPDTK